MANISTGMTLLYSEGSLSKFAVYRVIGATSNGDSIVVSTAFSAINGGAKMKAYFPSTSDFTTCTGSGTTLNLSTAFTETNMLVFIWGDSA